MGTKQPRGSAGASLPSMVTFGLKKHDAGVRGGDAPSPGCSGTCGDGGHQHYTGSPLVPSHGQSEAACRLSSSSSSSSVQAGCCPSGCSFLSHLRHQQHPRRMAACREGQRGK